MARLTRWLRLRQAIILTLATALPSLIGCPTLPPGDQWGRLDEGCVDMWSIAHFASGAALGGGLGEDGFWPSTGLLIGWEVLEPALYPGESHRNQVCDVVVGDFGWLAADLFRR